MKTEPLTQEQITAIQRIVGHVGSIITRLYEVDITRGRLKIGDMHHVVWTTDGHRIDITFSTDGGAVTSASNQPDPDAPPKGTHKQ